MWYEGGVTLKSWMLHGVAVAVLVCGCSRGGPGPVAPGQAAGGSPWPQALDHASTPETHRRAVTDLIVAMEMEAQLRAAIDAAMKMQVQIKPELQQFEDVLRAFLGKYLSLEGVREPITQMYMARFSELELVQLAAFYRTPLGRRTLQELPKVMEEGQKIGMAQVQAHMGELVEMIREKMARDGVSAPAP